MTKRRKAFVDLNNEFKAIIEFKKIFLVDLEKAGRNLRSLFPGEDLDLIFELTHIHLKFHLENLDAANIPTNPVSLCQWLRD